MRTTSDHLTMNKKSLVPVVVTNLKLHTYTPLTVTLIFDYIHIRYSIIEVSLHLFIKLSLLLAIFSDIVVVSPKTRQARGTG